MKTIFEPGDIKRHLYEVQQQDVAAFNGKVVHPVCSTFTLGREMEWASRLFVLEMREEDEEGIGTLLKIEHRGPARVGEILEIEAKVKSVVKNELICSIDVQAGGRLIAIGETGQRILKREKLAQLYS